MSTNTFYVTTPIYYVNDVPHIGHLYTTIAADVLARYHRALGKDVRFLTGTDEHGQKIEEAAAAKGLTPRQLVDEVVLRFQDAWKRADVTNDDFIRTTEERHKKVVMALWKRLEENGDIYLAEYEGQYCVACEEFYTETQAPEGKCPVHLRVLDKVKEESYFFRLSKYTQPLLEHYERVPSFIRPENRYNEIVSFVRGGLRDLSISRTKISWGIPVDSDPKHVVYVWLDALTNYISALGRPGDDPKGLYEKYWPADVHLVGKDILRFHTVYWPAFLMSAGWPLPKQVYVHGWWTVEGQKMSKSLGNVIRPDDLFDTYGVDPARYFLLREFPFGGDGDFSKAAITGRYNAELANDLGNLLNRTIGMVGKYLSPELPVPKRTATTEAMAAAAATAVGEYHRAMDELQFSRALEAVFALVRAGNKYIDVHQPWALHKAGDSAKLTEVLGAVCESLRIAGSMLAPYLPTKMAELATQLGISPEGTRLRALEFGGYAGPFKMTAGTPLFPRIDVKAEAAAAAATTPKAAAVSAENTQKPAKKQAAGDAAADAAVGATLPEMKAEIAYEDFGKLDLRVGLIKAAERVKKSDKLLKLQVDIGEERQVVAGIGKRYAPEDLVGKRVIVVANLRPVLSSTVGSEAWNSRDLKSRPH